MRISALPFLVLAALLLLSPGGLQGQDPPPVVHALLFYSPTCPHCHQVINEHLVPMQNRWGNQLLILAFDVTQRHARPIYLAAVRHF